MKKLPDKVSTVSEMQRQLEEMELQSMGFSASQNSLMQSRARPNSFIMEDNENYQDVHEPYTKIHGSTYDINQAKKRVAKLVADIRQGQLVQHQTQIHGTGKHSVISATESSRYFTTSSCSNSSIGRPRFPMQMVWNLGLQLKSHGSVRLRNLFGEFGGVGCQICQGFGHSKSNCVTKQKLKLIQHRQPVYTRMLKLATVALDKKIGIYEGYWLYSDLIATACAEQRKKKGSDPVDSENMQALLDVLLQEVLALSQRRCEYCDGYGHLGSDKTTVKLGKRTRVPSNARYDVYGRTTYVTYTDSCPTKHNLERSIIGFSESKQDFAVVMAAHRAQVKSDYIKKKSSQSSKSIPTLATTADIVSHFKEGLIDTEEEKAGPVAKKSADDIRKSALEIESSAVGRAEKIAAVAEDEQGRLSQFFGFEDEIFIKDLAYINEAADLSANEKLAAQIAQGTNRWFFLANNDGKAIDSIDEYKPKFGNFPYFKAKYGTDNQYAIAMLIDAFVTLRPKFDGIPDNFEKPATNASTQNLYGVCFTNPLNVLAAMCQNSKAFKRLLTFSRHIQSKLTTAGKALSDYSDVSTDMLGDWNPEEQIKSIKKVKKLKYFAHYREIMKKATNEIAALAAENNEQMEDEEDDS